MADNNFKTFFDALKNLDIFTELEETRRHQNDTNDHEIQLNSLLESDSNFSASNFSREPRVAHSLPTPFSIQGFGSSFDIPTWASLAGSQQSISEGPEENLANSFVVPFETARGDFCRTDDSQSNLSEHSSSQHNIGWGNRRPMQKKRPRNASFGAEDSTCGKKENKGAEFFPRGIPTESDTESPPQTSKESDANEALAQTAEDYREFRSASSIFSPVDDISSIDMATDRVLLGSVAGAEAVSAGRPSGIQTQSRETGMEKLHVCDVCGKAFARKSHLQEHTKTHTGDKPFECKFCSNRFAQQVNLKRHLLIHTGEKSFVCDICGKRFAQKTDFERHLRIHSGEKPYKCEFCDACFAHQSSCIRHQRRKHGGCKYTSSEFK